jgi:hypothetical protein
MSKPDAHERSFDVAASRLRVRVFGTFPRYGVFALLCVLLYASGTGLSRQPVVTDSQPASSPSQPTEPALVLQATAYATPHPTALAPSWTVAQSVSTTSTVDVLVPAAPSIAAETATATARPTHRPLTPSVSPASRNPFFKWIEPLVAQAHTERAKAKMSEPDYSKRIDISLNEQRINILAFGYGITYEPPWPPDRIGSISVFSLNLRTGLIDQVTINHDVRAPEIERHLQALNPAEPKKAHKIDKAMFLGGRALLKRIVEDVTGLHIDYVITFNDVILKHLVDTLEGVTITNPYAFKTNPCYIAPGKEVPGVEITAKKQQLSGDQAICFLKGIEIVGRDERYLKWHENAHRIPILKQGIAQRLNERLLQDPMLTVKLAMLLKDFLNRKEIQTNLDIANLVPAMLGLVTPSDIVGGFAIPATGATVYLVHEHSGDGGFVWVETDDSEITRKDIANEIYTRANHFDSTFAVAARGNPDAANLVGEYWQRAREIVKQKLR